MENLASNDQFMFDRNWLSNGYKEIKDTTKKAELVVRSVSNEPYYNEKADVTYYIVNLKGFLLSNKAKIKEAFGNKEFIPADDLKGLLLSVNIFVNDGVEPELPIKGETVTALFQDKKDSETGEKRKLISSILISKPEEVKDFSWDDDETEISSQDEEIEEIKDIFEED